VRPRRILVLGALAWSIGGACNGTTSYQCSESSQCMSAGIAGMCQPDGWCSFPDTACPSGQRYGAFVGDALAEQCVPADGTTGEGSDDGIVTSVTTETGSSDPTGVDASSGSGDSADPVCGDGSIDPGEMCDDADAVDDDECTNACTLPRCGDAIVQADEGCDEGDQNADSGACTTSCGPATCGDGLLRDGVEECDGRDLGGADCASLGYPGLGVPTCTSDCTLEASSCAACSMMGVDCNGFVPCDDMCEGGALCLQSMPGVEGTCLPPCDDDADCSGFARTWPTACVDQYCVIDCAMTENCPAGMQCLETMLGPICVW